MTSPLTVSAITLALLAVLLIALSLNVSRLRLRHRASYGEAGHKDLLVAVRAHGNTLEQTLLFFALLLCAELATGQSRAVLGGIATAFMAARLLYVAAVFGRRLPLRQAAHGLSVLLQLALVAIILASAIR